MVEMLCVLAIIGVLSIGSVVGFRYAMNRYEANRILADVKVFHFVIKEQGEAFDEMGQLKTNSFKPETKYTFDALQSAESEGAYYRIEVYGVSKGVCRALLATAGINPFEDFAPGEGKGASKVGVGDGFSSTFEWSDGKNNNICSDENALYFYFGDVSGACNLECAPDEECYYGGCCTRKNQCGSSCCASDTQMCCGGQCYSVDCGKDSNGIALVRSPNTCSCTCDTSQGYNGALEGGKCTCNGNGGFVLDASSGKCVCPNGKINVNGTCRSFGCYTGMSGDGPNGVVCTSTGCSCFLDQERCGSSCSGTDSSTCRYGVCYDACTNGGRWGYDNISKLYGCFIEDDKFFCRPENAYGNSSTGWNCTEKGNSTRRCGAGCDGSGTCRSGDCTDICSSYNYEGVSGTHERVGGYWGCRYNQVSCVKRELLYECNRDGNVCATGCKNAYPDGTCKVNTCDANTLPCPTGTTYNASLDACVRDSDGVYCKIGRDANYWCYLPNNTLCGQSCSLDGECSTGCCDGTDGSKCCGSELDYQLINSFYGCYNKTTEIGCFKIGNYYNCMKKGSQCGISCSNYEGKGCVYGLCDETECTSKGFSFQSVESGYFGCYNSELDLSCRKNSSVWRCFLGDSAACGTDCGGNYDGFKADGSTACGTCRAGIFNCPLETQTVYKSSPMGCLNANDVMCRTDGVCIVNPGRANGWGSYRCGTGCDTVNLDGTDCKAGVCNPNDCSSGDSWIYNSEKDLFECISASSLTCENGTCYFSTNHTLQCGTGCKNKAGEVCDGTNCDPAVDDISCEAGICDQDICGSLSLDELSYGTEYFFGCYNGKNSTTCYPYGGTVYCVTNNIIVGKNCNLDGSGCHCESGFGKAKVDAGAGNASLDTALPCRQCSLGSCSSSNGTTCVGNNSASGGDKAVCMACPQGTYMQYSGYGNCAATSVGFYTEGTGNSTQMACPAGTSTDDTGYYYNAAECLAAGNTGKSCGCREMYTSCRTNSDCADDEFCSFEQATICSSSGAGSCRKVSDWKSETISAGGKTWTKSKTTMKWWSSQNWCLAQGKSPVSRSDIGCSSVREGGYCLDSDLFNSIREGFNYNQYVWLEDWGNSCYAYYVFLSTGYVNVNLRNDNLFAFCRE